MSERNQNGPIPQPATGGRLRRLREQAEMTQDEVAEAMGVSRQAVSKWEAEDDPPEWPKLARVLGVKESYPAAPFNPEKRRRYFAARTIQMSGAKPPPSGIFGRTAKEARA